MADVSVIGRISGSICASGANQPFFLDAPESVFWIDEGYLDIFSVEREGPNAIGRRLFVTRLSEGMMAFGVPAEEAKGARDTSVFSLLGVSSQNAVIFKGHRAGLATPEGFDLDTTIWIDTWITHLSEFLGRSTGSLPPLGTHLLEADPGVRYPADSTVSAHHLDVVWVSANRPVRFIATERRAAGGSTLIEPESPWLPLSERTWLTLDAETEVSAVHTPTICVTEQLWPALDAFHRIVQAAAIAVQGERYRKLEIEHEGAAEMRQLSTVRAFHHLGAVLDAAESPGLDGARRHTPLEAAASLVAQSVGTRLVIPRRSREHGALLDAVAGLARASRIRTRRLSLAPGWWRHDGNPFLGRTSDGGNPIAVLPSGRGTWRAIDPGADSSFAVNDETAPGIANDGLMFYAPLPEKVRSGAAALRHTLRGFGRELRVIVAMATLVGLLALAAPVLTGQLLAEVIPRVDVPVWVAYLGALLVAAFGTAVFEIVRALAMVRIESRADERLQSAVWSRLLSLPATFFRNYTVGDLADRANGISQIRQVITGVVASGILSGVFSIFSFVLLFYYHWQLALCAGALVLVLIGGTWFFAQGQMSHFRAAFRVQGAIDGFVFQMLSGLAKLRVTNAESHALARWAERFSEQKRETLAARRWAAGQAVFSGMFSPLAMLAIFAFILFVIFEGEDAASFSLADFLSFNAAFGQFAAAMTGLASAWTMAVAVIPLFERVQPILEAQPESTGGMIDPGDLSGDIEFANVSFRYLPEVPNAVDGVSFHVRAGDYVAFVGTSGSGKSTLYRLLLGFERPDTGSVFLDGHDLASLDQSEARRRMGVVLQNGQLAAASILKNIVGSSTLTMEDAWEAAEAVGLDEDIKAMPMGMHTVLPEGGMALSGGQKQRLLIARALVHKPRIVLLDEATSALDNRTQEIVQNSLKGLRATRLVIAHRLSTVRDADRIYVMERGRIVEAGKYADLMKKGGVFAALAKRQLV